MKNQYRIVNLTITIFLLSGCDQISGMATEINSAVDGIKKNVTNTNAVTIRDTRRNAEALCINKVAALHPNRRDIHVKSGSATDYERFDIIVEAYYDQEEQDAAEKNGFHQKQSSGVHMNGSHLRDDYYCVTDRAIVNLEKFPEMKVGVGNSDSPISGSLTQSKP